MTHSPRRETTPPSKNQEHRKCGDLSDTTADPTTPPAGRGLPMNSRVVTPNGDEDTFSQLSNDDSSVTSRPSSGGWGTINRNLGNTTGRT